MSGHSKWATIKHKKGAADKKRGKLFAKLIKQVEVAARQGGGDPDANPTLRTMFQKARDASVPLDTIERAVKRGTGELEGVDYESITYEGYAPHGVALYVETLTDNRNRTGSEVRSLLSKNGGSLAEPGSVAWQFERKGVILLDGAVDEDEIMMAALDAGADDLVDEDGTWRLTCEATDLPTVRSALDEAGVPFENADVTMLATTSVSIDSAEQAKAVLRVMDLLDDNDDVQDVYANFDIPAEVLEALDT
ncbi:MAG: YebC/PmpR family DNA-binding transcriptional regulator [Actinomycetota bacterium]|nr:YebC/PmpR family DNA-binding transcriptional regulator [Actinomycetota bacterium]MEC9395506.1 YebC/PmpR family DNA-binding transcriptional regulator [Actinomycetota bacterium]MEC9467228.1 YebC/PmpR family DNA-binding transcriptional regulator [Actinomycetota bacterium]MED6327529.1 YebC/PmpR family DNA-binding transcriptional regulator [Actinomycetota bacterium]MEE2957406.1 YebC/PmpR family DNA-binding transcriptional regulator [Actinomycetota bacterium]